jgi:hypothetical protein
MTAKLQGHQRKIELFFRQSKSICTFSVEATDAFYYDREKQNKENLLKGGEPRVWIPPYYLHELTWADVGGHILGLWSSRRMSASRLA